MRWERIAMCYLAVALLACGQQPEVFSGEVSIVVPERFRGAIRIFVDPYGDPGGRYRVRVTSDGIGVMDGPYPYWKWVREDAVRVSRLSSGSKVPWRQETGSLAPGERFWRNFGLVDSGDGAVPEWWIYVGDREGLSSARDIYKTALAEAQRSRK